MMAEKIQEGLPLCPVKMNPITSFFKAPSNPQLPSLSKPKDLLGYFKSSSPGLAPSEKSILIEAKSSSTTEKDEPVRPSKGVEDPSTLKAKGSRSKENQAGKQDLNASLEDFETEQNTAKGSTKAKYKVTKKLSTKKNKMQKGKETNTIVTPVHQNHPDKGLEKETPKESVELEKADYDAEDMPTMSYADFLLSPGVTRDNAVNESQDRKAVEEADLEMEHKILQDTAVPENEEEQTGKNPVQKHTEHTESSGPKDREETAVNETKQKVTEDTPEHKNANKVEIDESNAETDVAENEKKANQVNVDKREMVTGSVDVQDRTEEKETPEYMECSPPVKHNAGNKSVIEISYESFLKSEMEASIQEDKTEQGEAVVEAIALCEKDENNAAPKTKKRKRTSEPESKAERQSAKKTKASPDAVTSKANIKGGVTEASTEMLVDILKKAKKKKVPTATLR